jgi:hypothetical protein
MPNNILFNVCFKKRLETQQKRLEKQFRKGKECYEKIGIGE